MMTTAGLNMVSAGGLRFVSRGPHDDEVYREVVEARCYEKPRLGFSVRRGERWLDCGANVGAFAVWAEKKMGAEVFGYEACSENTVVASENLRVNGCRSNVQTAFVSDRLGGVSSVSFNERTPARSSSIAKGVQRFVKNVSLADEIEKHKPHGLKIDIEGGELPILDAGIPLDGIRAMAVEYHFRFDKDCAAARRRIAPLMSHFKHNSVPKTIFMTDKWPAWQDAILFFWS
jgi:FkbM family methyltransferase